MTLKRILTATMLIGLGFMGGALTQAASEVQQEREARTEYCVPLYDMPGIERVRCDPLDGAR